MSTDLFDYSVICSMISRTRPAQQRCQEKGIEGVRRWNYFRAMFSYQGT
jgi:hypothetical protein